MNLVFTSVLYFLWSHRHLCRCFQNVNSDRSPNILLCILISTAGSDVLLPRLSKELIAVKTITFKRRRNIANKMSNCSNLHTISGKKKQSLFLHQGIKIGHWFQLLKNIKSKRKKSTRMLPNSENYHYRRLWKTWEAKTCDWLNSMIVGSRLIWIKWQSDCRVIYFPKYQNMWKLLHNYTCVAIQVLGKLLRTFQSASKRHVTQTYFNVSLHFPTSPLMHKVVCSHGIVLIS